MIENESNQEVKNFRFVKFKLNNEWYGQDITYIHEVNKVQSITEIPASPDYIVGVMNLRGRVIPVMDLRRRLGMPLMEITKETRVIVTGLLGSVLGLMVDSVYQVSEISTSRISKPPETAVTERNKFIQGIGQMDDELVFFIDIESIFDEEIKTTLKIQV
jgi:purine-binding chemotaxis protein CheW